MMSRKLTHWLSQFVALSIIACTHTPPQEPLRIDGSTPEKFQASWDQLNRSLTPHQQNNLSVAILPIALGKYKSATDIPSSLKGLGPQDIRTQVNGMTYDEIIDLAERQPVKVRAAPHQ